MEQNKITNVSSTKKKVYTEITINAPIEKVWEELTNFKDMPLWSKALQSIEGDFKKDGMTTVKFMNNKGKVVEYQHKQIHFENGKSFGWSDPFLLGITDNHKYELLKMSDSETKLVQTDEANGFFVLFLGKPIMSRPKIG